MEKVAGSSPVGSTIDRDAIDATPQPALGGWRKTRINGSRGPQLGQALRDEGPAALAVNLVDPFPDLAPLKGPRQLDFRQPREKPGPRWAKVKQIKERLFSRRHFDAIGIDREPFEQGCWDSMKRDGAERGTDPPAPAGRRRVDNGRHLLDETAF